MLKAPSRSSRILAGQRGGCPAACNIGAQDLETRGLGTNPSGSSPGSAWHAASQLISGSLATSARSSAGKLCCIWPCSLSTELGEASLARGHMCSFHPERGMEMRGREILQYGKLKTLSDEPCFLLFHSKAACGEGRSSISRQLASGSYRNFKHSHSNKNTSLHWSFLPLWVVAFCQQEPPQPWKTPGSLSLGLEIFLQIGNEQCNFIIWKWRDAEEKQGILVTDWH